MLLQSFLVGLNHNGVHGTSLAVQLLRHLASNAGSTGLIPGCIQKRKGGDSTPQWLAIQSSGSEVNCSFCLQLPRAELGMTERRHFHFSLSCIGEGNGNPLQYCLENPVDGGAWWAAVHRVAQSWTRLKRLSMHGCIGEGNGSPLQYSCLENPRDRGVWWAAVYGVAQSWTRLK